jgi:CheY-like chemotaxis protein
MQTFADVNFRIIEVNNGDAAIRTFEEIRPNVVLADIYMPGKNGYQVCAYIRSHSELNRTPVVLLVGAFEAFDEDTAKQAGATASITKPFEPSALIELVKSIMLPVREEAAVQPPPVASETIPPPATAQAAAAAPAPAAPAGAANSDTEDLLGLASIFKEDTAVPQMSRMITEDEIDRIAERVMQKLSTQVVESIAWEVVPDITEKVLREELKRVK